MSKKMKLPVMVFESKTYKGVLLGNEPGDEPTFSNVKDAMMIYNTDFSEPDTITFKKWIENNELYEEKMKEHYGDEFMFTFDFRNLFKFFNPVIIEVDENLIEGDEEDEK